MERNLSPRLFRDGIKQAIHKPAFPLVVESLGDVDIFTDDRLRRDVDACQKFIAPGPQNLVNRLVQTLKGTALGQPYLDQGIDLSPALVHTGNDVVAEIAIRIGLGYVLDCLAETMLVTFMQHN